jgi:ribosome-binding protein aMBF1 (putative translation factor)
MPYKYFLELCAYCNKTLVGEHICLIDENFINICRSCYNKKQRKYKLQKLNKLSNEL